MYNLATLLEDSARNYPDRDAVVLGDTRLTYAQVNGAANQVANLLVSRGIRARRQGRAELPQPALLHDRLLRHPQGRRDRRPAQRAAQGPRGGLPPRRLRREGLLLLPGHPRAADRRRRGTPASSRPTRCEHFFVITADPAAASPIEGTETLGAGDGRASRRRSRPSRPTRTTPRSSSTPPAPPGQPKGAELRHRNMRDNALAGETLFGADKRPPRHLPVRAAAVPLLRPDRHPERRVRVRRHRRDAAALRGRTRARA